MTPNEFSEMTAIDMASENFMDIYAKADSAYMAAGELDKQSFCKDYRKHGLTATVRALTDEVYKQRRINQRLSEKLEQKESKMATAAYALIDAAANIDDDEIADSVYNQAVALIGRKKAVKYSLENGYGLTDQDREYIIEAINNL